MAFFGIGGKTAAPRVTVVSTMKDEGAYILDWVAHYKALGATDIVVFTNDCTDPTDHILRNLNRMGLVHHRFSRVMKRGPHKSALMWAEHEPAVREADWLYVADVDEFLQINVGDGTFGALLNEHNGADAISTVWRIFGNGGVREITDTPVPQEFTLAETAVPPEGNHRFFKTLFRNNHKFNRMGVHRPFPNKECEEPLVWITPDGTRFNDRQIGGALHVSEGFGYEVAQLNHYALRSIDGFLNKQRRGRANHFKGTIDFGYWKKFDRNDESDFTLAESFGRALELKEDWLKDDALRRHHEAGFEWARKMARRASTQKAAKDFLLRLEERDVLSKAA